MYPPSIRFRLYKGQDGKFTTKCYDSQKNEVELDEAIQKDAVLSSLLSAILLVE